MKKNFVIRAYARPCGVMLDLQVNGETGKTQFIAKKPRSQQSETIHLTAVASKEILKEIEAKSGFNVHWGHALQTVAVSQATKELINNCWDELKHLKPQFCIK